MLRKRSFLFLVVVILALTPLLAACSKPAPTTAPTQAPAEATKPSATTAPKPTDEPAPTAEPQPAPGGTLVLASTQDPPTLDAHLATWDAHIQWLGATLVTRAPDGNYVPYLAESWTVSDDGLVYDFKLKKNVKFHNGEPLTAHDWIYTIERAKDPATNSNVAKGQWDSIKLAEAISDYELRFTLEEPFCPLLLTLSGSFCQPLSKTAIEQYGETYGRNPVGVGPYRFKEWVTGQRIVYERNPEYNWGPDFAHPGPWYIETVEFRILPDESTILAGLEAGELDYSGLEAKDVERIKGTGNFQIFEGLVGGMDPSLAFNVSKPPFDDVRLRQAFSWAIDREALLKAAVREENATVQYGPLSPPVYGYWPGIEKIGYTHNPDKVKALMEDAGYTLGANGMYEKDGQPFKVVLLLVPGRWTRVAEILKEQYKEVGLDVELNLAEVGVYQKELFGATYEVAMVNWMWPDGDLLWMLFHSSQTEGGINIYQVKDPELDKILDASRNQCDTETRLDLLAQAQQRIVEQAYCAVLYIPKTFLAVSNKVKGAYMSPVTSELYLNDAYIETQ